MVTRKKSQEGPADLRTVQMEFWTLQAKLERARKPETRAKAAHALEIARGRYHQLLDLQAAK